MNDPTNWNIDPSIKSIEVENPEMAKEMAKRWNAYPHLVAALREAARLAARSDDASDFYALLKELGEE